MSRALSPRTAHRAGLSDIISTPQEYVLAKLLYGREGEGYAADQREAVRVAIAEFEKAGEFEDQRKPPFIIGRDGEPTTEPNPERHLASVPFQGEHNLYYRHLVVDYGISPFTSRTTGQFEVLNTEKPPDVDGLDDFSVRQFISIHSECAKIFKRTIYNDVYASDPLYLDFCRLFITWMAIIRTLNERTRITADIDHMGRYDLVNLLYSYGFYDLNKMTDVYQRRFLKQVNTLLASKGTDKVLRDILNIFKLGKSLKVWRHHVVKHYPHKMRKVTYSPPSSTWSATTIPSITLGGTTISGSGLPPFRRLVRLFKDRTRPGFLHGISNIEIAREQRHQTTKKIIETDLLIRRNVSSTPVVVRHMNGTTESMNDELERTFTFRSNDGDWSTVTTDSGNGIGFKFGTTEMKSAIDAESPLEDIAAYAEAKEVEGISRVRADVEGDNEIINVSLKDPGGTSSPMISGSLTGGGSVASGMGGTDYGTPEVGFYRSDFDSSDREEAIKDLKTAEIEDYDDFRDGDPYWRTTEEVAKRLDFSSLETKYFSVTAGLDIVRNSMGIAFLREILEHIHESSSSSTETNEPTLQGTVGEAENVTLLQALVGMQILSLGVVGADDRIPHGASGKILSISREYSPIGVENDLLGVAGRSNDLLNEIDYEEVVEEGTIDKAIEYIDNEMAIADLYRRRMARYGKNLEGDDDPNHQYARWRTLNEQWQARYVDDFNTSVFGEGNNQYLDWLVKVNPAFGAYVKGKREAGVEDMQEAIRVILVAVEDEVDSDNLNFVSSLGFSTEQIGYLRKLFFYFKSYTVDFKEISLALQLFDPVFDGFHLLSDIQKFSTKFTLKDERERGGLNLRITRFVKGLKNLGRDDTLTHMRDLLARFLAKRDMIGSASEAITAETLLKTRDTIKPKSRFKIKDWLTRGGLPGSPAGLLMAITNPGLHFLRVKTKVRRLLNRGIGTPAGLLLGITQPEEESLHLNTDPNRSAFVLDNIPNNPPATPAGMLLAITRSTTPKRDLRGDFLLDMRYQHLVEAGSPTGFLLAITHTPRPEPNWIYRRYAYERASLDYSGSVWSIPQPESSGQRLDDTGLLSSGQMSLLVYDPGDFHRLTRRRINGEEGWPFGGDQEWFQDFATNADDNHIVIDNAARVSTPGSESATWTEPDDDLADGGDIEDNGERRPSVFPDWVSGTGEDAYISRFALRRSGGAVQIDLTLKRNETGYPEASLTDEIMQEATWEVVYGTPNIVIAIGGPDHDGEGAVRDSTSPYTWTPQTSAQAALGTLLDGIVGNTITDVRLRVRHRSSARYLSTLADLEKIDLWSIRVVVEMVVPQGSLVPPNDADLTYTLRYGTTRSLGQAMSITPGEYLWIPTMFRYAQVQVDLGETWQGAGISTLRLEWNKRN